MKQIKLIFLALVVTLAFSGFQTSAKTIADFTFNQPQHLFKPYSLASAANNSDKGDFKIGLAPEKGKKPKISASDLELSKMFQSVADDLNGTFALPNDVYIAIAECGESNAFYESTKRQVTMCIELYEEFDKLFKPEYKVEAERDDAVASAFTFVFFHELGHALVDIYELPIAGREEDAVDGLSTWLLIGTDAGDMTALNSAVAFALLGDNPNKKGELPFWDEHSLNSQRFYNTICLIYGQNPKKYKEFVKNGMLPENRAARCPTEFEKTERGWSKLLQPHIK